MIDGDLSKAFWDAAAWTEDFIDILGEAQPKPRFRTRVKMLWDEQHLYIAAELEEPQVWATLTDRDSVIFHDNDFEIFLDPDGDNHLYAEIEMNALNTVWDLLLVKPYRDGGPALTGWDIRGLQTAVRIDGTLNDPQIVDRGWTAELAIPWSGIKEIAQMPCPPNVGDQWRINFSRVQWQYEIVDGKYQKKEGQPEDNWVWCAQPRVDMHQPEAWGVLQFAESSSDQPVELEGVEERSRLMDLYERQRLFRREHGRYADATEIGWQTDSFSGTAEQWMAQNGDWIIDHTSRLRHQSRR
jgi:hypothetical protein